MTTVFAPAVILATGINGLGAIRSLHKAGVSTLAVVWSDNDPVLWSRLPKRKLVVGAGGAEQSDEALLAVLDTIDETRPVMIPSSDVFVSFMMRHRDTLAQRFDFILPPDMVVQKLLDKRLETEAIASLGIPLPNTETVLPDRADTLLRSVSLPLIIKPRSFAYRKFLESKTVRVTDVEHLQEFYRRKREVLSAFVAQEIIPGGDDATWMCHCTFDRNSELVGAFTMQRLGMAPAHFGVTSYSLSRYNPEIIELARQFGRGMGYIGPAGLDFKYDHRDGRYKYIETDPRIQLCNYFDTTCGVNNVFDTYILACGGVPARRPVQREGAIFLNAFDDLYARYEAGEGVKSAVGRYISLASHKHVWPYFAWHDPIPAMVTGAREVSSVARSLARKVTGKRARQ